MEWVLVVIGPLGIVLGWYLNQRSEDQRFKREARILEHDALLGRASAVLRQMRIVAGEFRGMAGGMYLIKSRGSQITDQMRASMEEFNADFRELEAQIADCEIAGPAWLPEAAAPFMRLTREAMTVVQRMQDGLRNDDVTLVQGQIEDLDATADAFAEEARRRSNQVST